MENRTAVATHWYALYTKPHKEYAVRDLLRRDGIAVYLPEVRVAVNRRDRRGSRPFFPHYLFAKFDPHSGVIAKVRWTPGLRSIVSAGDRPVPVPCELVNHIRHRLDKMDVMQPEGRFSRGDVVRIVRGPFRDLEAIFERRLSPEGRVRVFLELMGRLVAADIDTEDLLPRR